MHSLDWRNFFSFENEELKKWFNTFTYPWEALIKIEEFFSFLPKGSVHGSVSPLAFIENPKDVFIGEGAKVEPYAYIQGPCYIGKGASVKSGAYLRGFVFVGEKAIVGHTTEVKRSLLLDRAAAPHFNYVGDSILGHDVNLGAGVKCANLRLDHKDIIAHGKECRINTGMRKLGAILGDKVQIGCNAVLNPGTIFGKEVLCPPCINTGGFALEKTIIKNRKNS